MAASRRAIFTVLANLSVLLCAALLIEVGGRLTAWIWPSYEVVFLEPEPVVGWRQVPGLRYEWTGVHWYAADFSVPIQVNSRGFRDLERQESKPEGVVRIALLGDSMVEALQVPFERSAGQLLEAGLEARVAGSERFEVLNFGISGYSVGQYLLAWERYASRYQPDYVILFVSGVQLARTVSASMPGAFPTSRGRQLRVRPTFRHVGGSLVRVPAPDLDLLRQEQQKLIATEFGGSRIRRRSESLLALLVDQVRVVLRRIAGSSPRTYSAGPFQLLFSPRIDEATLALNLAVVSELAAQVRRQGGRLVLADASRYIDAGAVVLQARLREFCDLHGLGYVPLSEALLTANRAGTATAWRHDGHFNAAGNAIFASALQRWLAASR